MLKYVISISSITKQEIHAMIDETKDDDYLRFGENDHEVSLLHLLYDEDEIEEMKQQGLQEGRQQVVQQAKKEVILSVLNKQPDWTDKMIAELLDVPEELVREVRAERAAG